MFAIAFLIGLYANLIFILGLINVLNKPVVIGATLIYIFLSIVFWKRFDERLDFQVIIKEVKELWKKYPLWSLLLLFCVGLILIGVLTPELSFDALWYHLTFPKLYLAGQGIHYIPGGLLYYSAMPKLGELLYVGALSFQGEMLAKLVHASFALLTGIAIYCVTCKFTSKKYAIFAVVLFFSNIVVLWEATIAYVDLIRTFFELMSLWGIIEYLSSKKKKWLIESALLLGLAVETKLIAVGTVVAMVIVLWIFLQRNYKSKLFDSAFYCLLVLVPSLGWLFFSYIHTGNPLYPLFSNYAITLGQDTLAFPNVITDLVTIFIKASDPISPIYLILFPLFFIVRKKLSRNAMPIFLFSLLGLIIWTVTPKTGGGRFLLPYLPALSIAGGIILSMLEYNKKLLRISSVAVLICMLFALSYRGLASISSMPVIVGLESKQEFLAKRLNFSYGDFSDIDGQFNAHIKPSSTVLLYGFHNLYYVNVPFIDASWVKQGDSFEYIATKQTPLPTRFKYWTPIYTNSITGVTLYSANQTWIY